MGTRLFNEMADHPAILQSDKGAAGRLALWTLSVIVLLQTGIIIWLLRPHLAAPSDAPPQVAAQVPAPSAPAVPAPTPVALGTLPALPPPPGALTGAPSTPFGSLPPPPAQLGSQPAMPPVEARTRPRSAPPQTVPAPYSAPQVPAPARAMDGPPVSLTNHPEVDELLASAREMLALNDAVATKAALEVLQRADLLLPEHPAVLRDMALAYQKLNDGAKAKALFERANAARSGVPLPVSPETGAGDVLSPPPTAADFTAPGSGPVTLGRTRVTRDHTATTGEKQVLSVELKSLPGTVIDASKITLDVFFYDLVDGKRVEQSKGDAPVWKFDEPVDFASGNAEIVDVIYHMPRLSEAEVREHGARAFHGFVARLHYNGQFMAETAEPRSLLAPSRGGLQGAFLPSQP